MESLKEQETQQELFPGFSGESGKQERFPSLQKSQKPIFFSTSVEQIVFLSILFVILCCLIFFLGVLRGKSIGSGDSGKIELRSHSGAGIKLSEPGSSVNAVSAVPVATQATQFRTVQQNNEPSVAPIVRPKTVTPLKTPNSSFVKGLVLKTPKYTIQLASYKGQNSALREIGVLRGKGYSASLLPSGSYYLVTVGQYMSEEDAARDLKSLKMKYKDCRLKKISKD